MSKRQVGIRIAVLLCVLVLGLTVLAMTSTNYRLDWFVPLSGVGGARVTSASYAANLTIGQTVIGGESSANYKAQFGYWSGLPGEYYIYLPFVLRN